MYYSQQMAEMFLNGESDSFMEDGHGGKRDDSFFDQYPELETEAKLFVADVSSQKPANFKCNGFANFINSSYYALTNTKKYENELIRFEKMCRLDLLRWGYKFGVVSKLKVEFN